MILPFFLDLLFAQLAVLCLLMTPCHAHRKWNHVKNVHRDSELCPACLLKHLGHTKHWNEAEGPPEKGNCSSWKIAGQSWRHKPLP